MEMFWTWCALAVMLVIIEVFTGTFYLLAIAAAMLVGSIAALFGHGLAVQIASASLACILNIAAFQYLKRKYSIPVEQVNFTYDIGQTVQLVSWVGERNARVSYRGAEWDAELYTTTRPDAERKDWRIRGVVGNKLIID